MTAHRTVAFSVTAATALAAALVGSGPAVAADASPGDTVIVNCVGKQVVKPKQIVLTCADAGISVQKITWRYWNDNRARGRGTLVWNTCLPTDCASGIVQKYKARIVLDRVASGPGLTVFSRMVLTFPNGGPANLETGTMTLPNEGG
jgi:hypothetical protein